MSGLDALSFTAAVSTQHFYLDSSIHQNLVKKHVDRVT
jgi:hypothetical protein